MVYTLGDDEFCEIDLSTFAESCRTFDSSYNIAATNGLAMNPDNGDLYIVASIGSNNGDRSLMKLDESTLELTTIATYTANSDKLAAIAFTCTTDESSAGLYGITGKQADHSLYSISITDGTLTKIGDLDASSKGNALTYSPYDNYLYRVAGTDIIDIEQINYLTIEPNSTITSDTFIDSVDKVSALGYAEENYLFLIDGNEVLYLFNTEDGDDIYNLTQLNMDRKHKGIICSNYQMTCDDYYGDGSGAHRIGLMGVGMIVMIMAMSVMN